LNRRKIKENAAVVVGRNDGDEARREAKYIKRLNKE